MSFLTYIFQKRDHLVHNCPAICWMSWLVRFYFNQWSKTRVPGFFLLLLSPQQQTLSVLLLLFQCLSPYLEIIWLGLCQLTFSFNVGPKVLSSPSVTCRNLSCPRAPVLTVSLGLERHPRCAVRRQGTPVLLTGMWSFIPWIRFFSFHCLAPELTTLVLFFVWVLVSVVLFRFSRREQFSMLLLLIWPQTFCQASEASLSASRCLRHFTSFIICMRSLLQLQPCSPLDGLPVPGLFWTSPSIFLVFSSLVVGLHVLWPLSPSQITPLFWWKTSSKSSPKSMPGS